jgi:methenyltetrahydromethanopterin cyclohydrolase
MDSLNRQAVELVDELLEFAPTLDAHAFELAGGTTVIDCGVASVGSVGAGLLCAEIQTAGLAGLSTPLRSVDGVPLPHVQLTTDHPALALLGAQKAGWELSFDAPPFEGLGSGPARALVASESEYRAMEYVDAFDMAVLAVESATLPDDRVATAVAEAADVAPTALFMPAYATASITGSVAAAARAPELALFRLFELGYDITQVLTASGTAPIAPVAGLAAVASQATAAYGTPFAEIFASVGWDFYDLDPALFAPAEVTVSVVGGPTHHIGGRDQALVAASFDIA